MGSGGVLYGTTEGGGTGKYGALYSLSPPSSPGGAWTETILHSFQRRKSGPATALTVAADGTIYAAISSNRKVYGDPGGAIFAYKPPAQSGAKWSEKQLFVFPVDQKHRPLAPDGYDPDGPLVLTKSGRLYGVTKNGGASKRGFGYGATFALSPPAAVGGTWTIKVLHSFEPASNAAYPAVGLVERDGALYGTTIGQSSTIKGTVFSIVP